MDARKVALGRRLFQDPHFSRSNKFSCAYCHNLATGGADRLPHSSEMDSTWAEVIAVLEKDAAYRRAFTDIYQEGIEPNAVKNAIATFER